MGAEQLTFADSALAVALQDAKRLSLEYGIDVAITFSILKQTICGSAEGEDGLTVVSNLYDPPFEAIIQAIPRENLADAVNGRLEVVMWGKGLHQSIGARFFYTKDEWIDSLHHLKDWLLINRRSLIETGWPTTYDILSPWQELNHTFLCPVFSQESVNEPMFPGLLGTHETRAIIESRDPVFEAKIAIIDHLINFRAADRCEGLLDDVYREFFSRIPVKTFRALEKLDQIFQKHSRNMKGFVGGPGGLWDTTQLAGMIEFGILSQYDDGMRAMLGDTVFVDPQTNLLKFKFSDYFASIKDPDIYECFEHAYLFSKQNTHASDVYWQSFTQRATESLFKVSDAKRLMKQAMDCINREIETTGSAPKSLPLKKPNIATDNSLAATLFKSIEEISWEMITIRFLDGDTVEISTGSGTDKIQQSYKFFHLGFADKRTQSGQFKSKKTWLLLKFFAHLQGVISRKEFNEGQLAKVLVDNFTDWFALKTQVKELRQDLIAAFGIKDDPFKKMAKKPPRAYEPKFPILISNQYLLHLQGNIKGDQAPKPKTHDERRSAEIDELTKEQQRENLFRTQNRPKKTRPNDV